MPIRVIRRPDRENRLYFDGKIHLPDGREIRVRQRAGSDQLALAREEAAALEAKILRDAYHGERRGARSFAQAVKSYVRAAPRQPAELGRLNRVMLALGDVSLGEINQETVDRVRDTMLPSAAPATVLRAVITPIRAIIAHAHKRDWCDLRRFEIPRQPKGRTLYLLPSEAEKAVAATATPRFAGLILFLLDTGARLGETLALDWREVDLTGGHVIFWGDTTKGGERRDCPLSPRTVAALASLPERDGPVFRWSFRRGKSEIVQPYADHDDGAGGQIKTAWKGTIRRAGLNPQFTPHVLRHSWASWHYAIWRDLLLLKRDGGWSSVALVERYAHLLPQGHIEGIAAFWGARIAAQVALGAAQPTAGHGTPLAVPPAAPQKITPQGIGRVTAAG